MICNQMLVSKKGEAVARPSLASHRYTTISLEDTKQVSLNLAKKVGRGENSSVFALCFTGVVSFVFDKVLK